MAINVVAGALAPSSDAVQLRTVEMTVNADVAEADLPRIALNQPANVTVTATGDQLTGTVSAIAPSASTASGTSVVSYAVTIDLPNVPDTVRPGMSAQVSVTTAAANNVLAIPAIALNGAAGNYTVRVLGANGAVEVAAGPGRTGHLQPGRNPERPGRRRHRHHRHDRVAQPDQRWKRPTAVAVAHSPVAARASATAVAARRS